MAKILDPKIFVSKNQPPLIYDIHKPWEEVIKKSPIWKSGKFPPLPKKKKYKFLGFDLISPIAISAGPASEKVWSDFYLKMGYGLVFEKTRRTVKRTSNEVPNIVAVIETEDQLSRKNLNQTRIGSLDPANFEKYKTITNSFGNPSPNVYKWSNILKEQVKSIRDGQIFGCSVTATFPAEGPSCVRLLGGKSSQALIVETASDLLIAASAAAIAGVQVVELNLACPNVIENTEEGEMFQNADLVKYVCAEFKRRFYDTKLGIKFGLYKNKAQMKKVFKAGGENLDYVSGINAISVPVAGEKGEEILPGRIRSGICGKVLQNLALEHIKWADEIRKEEGLKYEILGGGGIVEVSDVDKYLKAGADAVQVATIALADPLFAYKYFYSKHKK